MKKTHLILPFVVILISTMIVGCSDKQPSEFGLFESHGDIGECNLPGNFVFYPEKDLYTIIGSGENIWFDSDQLHYAWLKTEKDFIVRARIEFVGEGKNAHRKIGWMIRNSADTSSAHVSGVIHGDGLTALQYRAVEGGDMDEIKSEVSGPDVIQLERKGDEYTFTGAIKGTISDPIILTEVTLAREVFVGLFICSHDNTVAEKATFSDVEINFIDRKKPGTFAEYIKETS